MRTAVRTLVVALSVVLALPAWAAEVVKNDPDDSDGKLDLSRLVVDATKGEAGFFTIKTHDNFRCGYLKPGKPNRLRLLFDDGRDGDIDLIGRFECDGDKLLMFLVGKETGNNYEPLRARRPSNKTVKVAFQLDIAEFEADTLGVKVRTVDGTAEGCTDEPCKDSVPGKGTLQAY
ncbi:MAG: hypothetical protein ACLGHL_06475 [Actinomycetota bacterium]